MLDLRHRHVAQLTAATAAYAPAAPAPAPSAIAMHMTRAASQRFVRCTDAASGKQQPVEPAGNEHTVRNIIRLRPLCRTDRVFLMPGRPALPRPDCECRSRNRRGEQRRRQTAVRQCSRPFPAGRLPQSAGSPGPRSRQASGR